MKSKKTIKSILLSILCICCFIPVILVANGTLVVKRMGGMSTMGVIIGPIVGLDTVVPDTSVTVQTDYSSYNLTADTPYTNGALRAYTTIGVYNVNRSKTYNGFAYPNFIRAFKIKRTDGRPIYDDDGILDVSTSSSSLASEIVNYPSYLYSIETKLPNKPDGGFMWTNQQAKFKNAKLYKWVFGFPTSSLSSIDLPSQPSDGTRTIMTIMSNEYVSYETGQNYMYITLDGTGQYENTFWGNTGGDTDIDHLNLTNYIHIGDRDWSNTLTSSANSGSYKGQKAYYSPKSFTVVATNLNNYVKVNDVQATPQYGSSVVPFADGHHITISDNGITTIAIENGGEGSYTTYYCFVDTTLPDVSYTYHNSNALTNRKVGSITTDSKGAKSQTITEGVFKDQVQVNFSYNADKETPETATYTYNGTTKTLTSGTWLSQEGDYIVTIKDAAGNTTTSKFTIDKSAPSYNLGRLESDKSYKISKWYIANIPSGYKEYGSYSFAEYNMALSLAKSAEYNNLVTSYTLSNVDDFVYTNLLATGEQVKVGDYWYYKSRENPNLYVYYFNAQALDEVVEYYAKNYVSSEQINKINATLTPNNYGNTIDDSVIDNLIISNGINGYIVNNFTFRFSDNNDTYKIYCDYQEDNNENWKELQYGIPFVSQVNSHGLYKIKEIDFVGHETYYYVYLDLNAPLLDIEAKLYGKDKVLTQTISKADIPANNELVFYYESFKITNIIEDDKWWTLEVKNPQGKTTRYTYLDELPNFDDMGSGEFTITIADRVNTPFTFKVYLLGKAPEAKFETINANTQLRITINTGESYNSITDLKIYRNGTCLNSEIGYDEKPEDDTNELIYISPNTLKYTFNKGGIYVVEITDNFGRTLSYEFKFEKDLPTGILVGVTHNGKTKDEVKFIYDSNKYFVVVNKDNSSFETPATTDKNLTTLVFTPVEESEIVYSIQLVDKTDIENYNNYQFTIKTIKPILHLFGVEPNGKTGGSVYATWDSGEEQYTATYTLDGKTQEYRKGQVLTIEGIYTITLQDEIFNQTQAAFEIDKTIEFIIADTNGNIYEIEDIRYINFDVRLIEKEPLSVALYKDDVELEYEFGLMITEEGEYLVKLEDEYTNTLYFTFTIDKTPPTATLYGVEEFGKTNGSAWIISNESNLSCWYIRNDNFKDVYNLGTEITTNGKYVVYVVDLAKNFITFEFEIDKEISYDINVYRGGISNGDVRLIAYENLKIVMYKDGKPIDYSFEQILNDEGEYSYTIIDELGNRTSSFFTIITKRKQNLNHILQEDISVISVLKDDENYEYQVLDNNLYLYDEGSYLVNILDERTSKEYSFKITLDTTPPTLELVGVENGGTTKKVVVMKNVSEQPYSIYITVDGAPFDYKVGEEIEKCGRFIVVLTDEAGNSTTYTFERLYSLNGPSIAILAGLGALVVLLIVLLIKSRHHYYKDEVIEEDLEETIVEDDFDDGDNENLEI